VVWGAKRGAELAIDYISHVTDPQLNLETAVEIPVKWKVSRSLCEKFSNLKFKVKQKK